MAVGSARGSGYNAGSDKKVSFKKRINSIQLPGLQSKQDIMKQLLPEVVHAADLEQKLSKPDKRARDELKIDSRHSERPVPFKAPHTINDSPRSAIQIDENNPLFLLK